MPEHVLRDPLMPEHVLRDPLMPELAHPSSTRDAYERAGLGGRVPRGSHPGIVVVDFQNGFTLAEMPLAGDLTAELAATRRLLDSARELGVPVIFTAIRFADDLSDANLWIEKVPTLRTLVGAAGADRIDERLARRTDEPVVIKRGPSAWYADGFTDWLTGTGVDCVVLAGTTTSGCVRATVVDLLQAGIATLVVRECVGDRAPVPHEVSLVDIDSRYADVIALEDALAYLQTAHELEPASGYGGNR